MLVSVIIPSYNYEKYIGQTLRSLIAQTYKNWECIVVDDGSTDNTRQVVTDFADGDERIKYIHQKNAGQASARNNGLRNAKGKYIQFLDADDLLEPLKLECQVEFLEKNSDVDIVYGETRYFRTEFPEERRYSLREPDTPWMPKISGRGSEVIQKLIVLNLFTVSSPLMRKKVIETVGDFNTALNPVEDWEYWMRCALANVSIKYYEADGTRDLIRIHLQSSSQNLRRVQYKNFLLRRKFDEILVDREYKKVNSVLLLRWERKWLGGEITDGISDIVQGKLIKGANRMWDNFRFSPQMFCKVALNKANRFVSARLNSVRSQ